MEILGFLNGISPWYWVAFAFALGALEMATMSFFLIWPALAGLCVAALLAASPTMSPEMQLLVFAALSVVLTIIGRNLLNKYGDGGEEHATLNKRGAMLVGRTANVLEYASGQGVIEVEGMLWRAHWPEGQTSDIGARVRITRANGMNLDVETMQG